MSRILKQTRVVEVRDVPDSTPPETNDADDRTLTARERMLKRHRDISRLPVPSGE